MKIAAFVYDFPHIKSSHGLFWLQSAGFNDVTCIASPYKVLNIPKSKTRITPKISAHWPEHVAKHLGYNYIKCDHDSDSILEHLAGHDIGVILGARRLKPHALSTCPVINMHPGVLPENRGLDNVKWAIFDNLPQAVTVHFVDSDLDRGRFIALETIDVFQDDTFLDIFLRLQTTELDCMVKTLTKINDEGIVISGKTLAEGKYNKVMNDAEDDAILKAFSSYKANYDAILRRYHERF
jgi:phosphoribosylglycinamide formyltransferase-1